MTAKTKVAKASAPKILKAAGRALWDDVVGKYTLRVDETRVLMFACRALDLADTFDAEWIALGCPMMSKGSTGQDVEHPLIGSADKQRKAAEAFLRQLKLPDDPAGAGSAPNQQREAAQSRWAAEHGKGA